MKKTLSLVMALILVLGMLPMAHAEEQITIRAAWWGGVDRNNMMNEIYDLYESEHPNVKIEREYGTWEDYWIRYSTQVAGGNPSDLIQFNDTTITSYINMGAVEPLDEYIEKGIIDISNFSNAAISAGKLNGKTYEITMGLSTPILEYNATALEKAGFELPGDVMSWDAFTQYLTDLKTSGKLPEGMWPLNDEAKNLHWFYTFLRQKGEELTNDAGEAGFTVDTVKEWFGWWDTMRKADIVLPYDRVAEFLGKPKEESALVMNAVAFFSVPGNQAKIYQRNMSDVCGITRLPSLPGGVNEYGEVVAGAYLAISSTSKHKEVVADIINFFVNDERANVIFKCEQGIYGNVKMQQAVEPIMDPMDVTVTELLNITLQDIPEPRPYASGTDAIIALLQSTNEYIVFGAMSVDEAAEFFMEEAAKIFRNAA